MLEHISVQPTKFSCLKILRRALSYMSNQEQKQDSAMTDCGGEHNF